MSKSRIISHGHRVIDTTYGLNFEIEGSRGSGFIFDCDKDGNVDESKLQPAGLTNYRACVERKITVLEPRILSFTNSYWEPTRIRCDCGEVVVAYPNDYDDHECEKCHRLYNGSGQELLPREQWEGQIDDDY